MRKPAKVRFGRSVNAWMAFVEAEPARIELAAVSDGTHLTWYTAPVESTDAELLCHVLLASNAPDELLTRTAVHPMPESTPTRRNRNTINPVNSFSDQ